MQHCKHALCRHVPKNRLQTDTNFLGVVTCTKLFAHKKRSALQWNVSEDKNASTADRVFDSCLFFVDKNVEIGSCQVSAIQRPMVDVYPYNQGSLSRR